MDLSMPPDARPAPRRRGSRAQCARTRGEEALRLALPWRRANGAVMVSVANPAPPQMELEMKEQPAVLAGLLEQRGTIIGRIGDAVPPLPSGLRGVALVGRGSSEAAALFGRYLLEPVTGRPALVVPPSVALGSDRLSYEGFLAVGATVLAAPHPPGAAAERLGQLDGWACVGRGLLRPVAQEAALKLEEVALVVADHHSSASFRHGPIATAGPHRPVLAFASGTPPGEDTTRRAHDLARQGWPVLVAGPGPDAELPLPALPEPLLAVAAPGRGPHPAPA